MNTETEFRLDIILYKEGYFSSREKARQAILEGSVEVDGKVVDKPSFAVGRTSQFKIIKEINPYVGRGGLKLEKAIGCFEISLKNVRALDVGASTGGFTDCMLRNGACFVCACDVGTGQLHPSLRQDPRVLSLEKTDIRELAARPEEYGIFQPFDIITVDVSFISLTIILPYLKNLLAPGGGIVCLVKPQFEAGRKNIGKGGIVKDPRVHKEVLDRIRDFSAGCGYRVSGIEDSPVKGGDGNKEFLMFLKMN